LGALGGPAIGSFLYYFGGYKCPLFTLATIYFLMVVCLFPLAKKVCNKDGFSELKGDDQDAVLSSHELNEYWDSSV